MENSENQDIEKIIKRLFLIKNLISLEDEEDIKDQLNKLKKLSINGDTEIIISLIERQQYSKAIIQIDHFIKNYNQLKQFIDPEIEALRFEAKTLERQINELNNEKSELDKLIHEFNVRHNQELGQLIIKILQFRKERSKGTSEYQEAEKDYNDYYYNYSNSKDEKIPELTDEQKKILKEKYRKASKLCHPDIVDQDQQEAAHKIFIDLREAYERNDLIKVSEILEYLKTGKAFLSKSDITNEKSILIKEIERLRSRLNELKEEIIAIRNSNTFITISNIEDWDSYFSKIKKHLEIQLSDIENGRK